MTKSSPPGRQSQRKPTKAVVRARGLVAADFRAALAVRRAAGDAGVSYAAIAERTGACPAQVGRWADDAAGDPVDVADIEAAGTGVALAFCRVWMARLQKKATRNLPLTDLVTDAHIAGANVAAVVRKAWADKHIDDRERAEIRAAAHGLAGVVAEILAAVDGPSHDEEDE